MSYVHRASLRGTTCGKQGPVSSSGIDRFITCPDCRKLLSLDMTPEEIREMQLASIKAAAERFRARQTA